MVPEKVGVNRCSRFCALKFLLCVNVQRTLAQNRHNYEPDLFMEELMMERAVYVYAIECAGFVKIGIAADTRTRLAALKLNCPLDMALLGRRKFASRQSAIDAERATHAALAGQRHKGEWFAMAPLNPLDVLVRLYPDANDEPEIVTPPFSMAEAVECMQRAEFWAHSGFAKQIEA